MSKFPCKAIAGAAILLVGAMLARAQEPDVVLKGTVTAADHQTYKEVPFTVPEGLARLTVEFSYTTKDQHTTIDLGIFDGERFRGWSGGNKSQFTLAVTDATPSFLPGPVRAGRWFLLLGIPNIRANVESQFTAKIYFGHAGDVAREGVFTGAALRTGPAWYRGDLHMHTGHSDGSCLSQSGVRVPCPVFRTIQAAAERGLDFIAITDHNTNSQFDSMRELQSYFDRVLLIPGREITTFHGHANVFGPVDFIDFRLGSKTVPDLSVLQDEVKALHGLISINHPMAASGVSCMGCGWTPVTDYSRINAVEAANGGGTEAAIPFWNDLLNRGFRITGVGGSDNHDADKPLTAAGSIGYPETVVHARELSQEAILSGIQAGHVFLDLLGSKDRLLECTASTEHQTAEMGDGLNAKKGERVKISVHTVNVAGDSVELIEDGKAVAPDKSADRSIGTNDSALSIDWAGDGGKHWLRVVVRTPEGKAVLLGNPVYVNF
jgi:hypothetical protein